MATYQFLTEKAGLKLCTLWIRKSLGRVVMHWCRRQQGGLMDSASPSNVVCFLVDLKLLCTCGGHLQCAHRLRQVMALVSIRGC